MTCASGSLDQKIDPLACTVVCSLRKGLLATGHDNDGGTRFCDNIT